MIGSFGHLGWTQSTLNGGRRSSSATSYLGPNFISRKNLHVLVNARVTRLLKTGNTRDGKPEMLGVEFVRADDTGKHKTPFTLSEDANSLAFYLARRLTVRATKEVVLSAGSVGTPHLLQLSGIGDRGHLSSLGISTILHNPSVGQNLSDHPLVSNLWFVNSNATFDDIARNATLAAEEFAKWQQTEQGPMVNTLLNHLAWLRVPKSEATFWQKFRDPAAGKNTAHYELLFSVSRGHVHPNLSRN